MQCRLWRGAITASDTVQHWPEKRAEARKGGGYHRRRIMLHALPNSGIVQAPPERPARPREESGIVVLSPGELEEIKREAHERRRSARIKRETTPTRYRPPWRDPDFKW